MARINVNTELTNIQNAVYGEEVRGSIHDAIEEIANQCNAAIDDDLSPLAFKGDLPTNTNLNNLTADTDRGIWRLLSSSTYTNLPPGADATKTLMLTVYRGGVSAIRQEIRYYGGVTSSAMATAFVRLYNGSSSTWTSWMSTSATESIASDYSTSSPYAVGDYVFYNGKLYRCNTAIQSGEAWTPSHWTATSISDGLNSDANNIIKVQSSQPTEPVNKIWIPDSEPTETQIPTYEEFEAVSDEVGDLKSAISNTINSAGALATVDIPERGYYHPGIFLCKGETYTFENVTPSGTQTLTIALYVKGYTSSAVGLAGGTGATVSYTSPASGEIEIYYSGTSSGTVKLLVRSYLYDKKVDKTTTVNGHSLSENVLVTKSDVGLGNVDNTSDADKPVSTATAQTFDSVYQPLEYPPIKANLTEIEGTLYNAGYFLKYNNGDTASTSTAKCTDFIQIDSHDFYVLECDYTGLCAGMCVYSTSGVNGFIASEYYDTSAPTYIEGKYYINSYELLKKYPNAKYVRFSGLRKLVVSICKSTDKINLAQAIESTEVEDMMYNAIQFPAVKENVIAINSSQIMDNVFLKYTDGSIVSANGAHTSDFLEIDDYDYFLAKASTYGLVAGMCIYRTNETSGFIGSEFTNISSATPVQEEIYYSKYDILKKYPSAKYVRFSSISTLVVNIAKQDRTPLYSLLDKSTNEDLLAGKKYYALGDSFTHGDWTGYPGDITDIYDSEWGVYKTYPYWIAKRNGMSLTNLAVNGSTIVSLVARGDYSAIPEDCDYATIMIGLNDTTNIGENEPMGDIGITDTTSWYGCWNTIMSWLRTNRPHLHFGVLIVSAYMSEELREATRLVCAKYGYPYLDMYKDPKVPAFMGKYGMDQTISDALYAVNKQSATNGHPTLECQQFMSTFIEDFIRGL